MIICLKVRAIALLFTIYSVKRLEDCKLFFGKNYFLLLISNLINFSEIITSNPISITIVSSDGFNYKYFGKCFIVINLYLIVYFPLLKHFLIMIVNLLYCY